MFEHLLVPLDGSQLAEVALPAAVYVAALTGADITLLHVLEDNPPQAVHGDHHLTTVDEACVYLSGTARRLPRSVVVKEHAHPNEEHDVARSIVMHAREMQIDLVVMCTHGRGNLRRLLFGTIAQKVIALGATPVLLIPPLADEAHGARDFSCQRILVPLDGDPAHEAGLTTAAVMAAMCGASLHLVMVVPTLSTLAGENSAAAKLLPVTATTILDMSEQQAIEYLAAHQHRLETQGVAATVKVYRGEPATAIVQATQDVRADLVAMATHGKTHLDAFWSGSVTPKVSRTTRLPLLLVPAMDR